MCITELTNCASLLQLALKFLFRPFPEFLSQSPILCPLVPLVGYSNWFIVLSRHNIRAYGCP